MKVAVVVGHAHDARGFCSKHGIECEWNWNSKVAYELYRINPDMYTIFKHDTARGGYEARQNRMAKRVNAKNFDLAMELHYNAFERLDVEGTEVFFFERSQKGELFARLICNSIVKDFGTNNRGPKPLYGGNGYGFLKKMRAPAVLIEPFFASNKSDVEKFKGKEREYARSLHNGILRSNLTKK